jgi:Transglycosylase SLT domain
MVSTINAFGDRGAIHQAIYKAASATGVDFNYLFNQARVESSLNPEAKARTSSATGLYQFIEQSWLGVVAKHGDEHGLGWAASAISRASDGRYRVADPAMRTAILDLRRDPDASAAMAAEFASDNRDYLETRLGHNVESVDLYLAHFLGAGGATKFLRRLEADPDAAAADVFPAAARSNRGVFFKTDGSARSLAEVRERFAAKFDGERSPTEYHRHAELVSASVPQREQLVPASQWTLKQVPGDGVKTNARLAYLMLASLGIST